MQGLTSPDEEKELLVWINNDSNALNTINAYYERKWKDIPETEIPAELQHQMLMNIKENIHQHKTTKKGIIKNIESLVSTKN